MTYLKSQHQDYLKTKDDKFLPTVRTKSIIWSHVKVGSSVPDSSDIDVRPLSDVGNVDLGEEKTINGAITVNR